MSGEFWSSYEGGGSNPPSDKHFECLSSFNFSTMRIAPSTSLSKHRGDGKVKLGRGPYAISIAILSMHTGFQHPRTKYMLAPGLRKLTFLCVFSCGFAKWSI